MANDCIAFYDEGVDISCQATATVTGRRFVDVSGAKQVASEALASTSVGGNVLAAHCGAGGRAFGVSSYDCASGSKFYALRGSKVVPVESGAAVTAGAQVMSDSVGRAITWTSAASEANNKLGKALNTTTAAGQTVLVALSL